MTMIRCPNCRGMKKVAKLGGMMGDCNLCSGTGQIKEADKVKSVTLTVEDVCQKELINAVADCVPASDIPKSKEFLERRKQLMGHIEDSEAVEVVPITPDVKIDGKKAIYKRKIAGK